VGFEPHGVVPLRQHPDEQIGTLLEGECAFELHGTKRTIRPGDVYVIPHALISRKSHANLTLLTR
jgi:quercetin dioxygenase-like cupin family protein